MAYVSVPEHIKKGVPRHVRGCLRSDAQTWITEAKCEVKPSKKHGLGLFVTKNIDPFELITLYPADGARLWLQDGKHTVHLKRFTGMTIDTCVDYSADVPGYKGWRIEIVGDPAKISDPFYLGHMANDYCQMTRVEQKDIYANISWKGMNAAIGCVPFEACFPEGRHLFKSHGIWSTKQIKAGEEIYVHYGEDYWVSKADWEAKSGFDLESMD
jgi:hypothetical protein